MVQDWIYSVCMFVFAVALVPQIVEGFRRRAGAVSLWTSVPTSLALSALAITVWTSGYRFGAAMQSLCAWLWFVLVLQRMAWGGKPRRHEGHEAGRQIEC